jgi:hypothetical protein
MAKINKSEISYGFWVGLGLLLAFAVWGLIRVLLSRAADRNG